MLFRILSLCFALLLCAALPAQSKTETRVKNRAENRANNNVDRKVDRAVDDAFNAVGNLFKKKKKNKNKSADSDATTNDSDMGNARGANPMGGLFGNNDFEPYTNEKSFSIVMHTTETKKNGKQQTAIMTVAVLPTEIAMKVASDGNDSRTLFDTQSGKTTLVSTDKKGKTEATRMRMPNFGQSAAMEDAVQEAQEDYTYEMTDETRTIDGYVCKKVIATDTKRNTVTEGWVTEAIDLSYVDIFGGVAAMFSGGGKQLRDQMPTPPMDGLMLEGTTTEANGRKTTVKLTDIKLGEGNVDRSLFDLSGIDVQDAGF